MGWDGEKTNKSEKTSSFSQSCVVHRGEWRANMDLALSGTLLLGLVCIYSQHGRNAVATGPVDKWIGKGWCTWFYCGLCSMRCRGKCVGNQNCWKSLRSRSMNPWRWAGGAKTQGMPGNHGGEAPCGVKSIQCESHQHKLKLIGAVALINFGFGCVLPWG